ncbi:BglG family transcription antiterminator [Neobacillus bataviensis]|uniref:BglG family transcription antiterminator n=1 Tax=Neobacillus bataviensis TaxID=220685 RepID=UPI001CBF9DA6|nr:BglG family transcription antiterminator [Neobacillus bataviensis]
MTLDQRSTAILSHLVKSQAYVPVKELTEKFHISRRTIYYDIEKINVWLKEHSFPPINHVRSAGFHLDEETAAQIPERLCMLTTWQYEYSAKERKAWLAIYLMTRDTPLFLEDLMEKTRVSRNTTIDDIKGLKEELERFELKIEFERKLGYVILGKEDDKRKAIVYYLQHVLSDQGWQAILAKLPSILNQDDQFDLFDYENLKAVQKIVAESEEELNIQFTDEFLDSLAFRLLMFSKRLSQGKNVLIDPIEKDVLKDTTQYQAARNISQKLADLFEIEFPEDEIFYITKHLLGSRIQVSEDINQDNSSSNSLTINKVVADMVSDFQKYACVFFKDRKEIEKNLLLHIRPAFYRVKYGLELESGMTETIKEKYQDIFLLTKKVIIHLEKVVGKEVNDNETALIAMHFGGWMKRTGATPAIRKKALIVCPNGVGTSRLLQNQLEGLFSTIDIIGCVSLRDYKHNQYDTDFIISTIPLEEKEKPIFVVSPILTEAEKESLLKKVNAQMESPAKHTTSAEAIMNIIKKYADVYNEESLQKELKQYLYKPAAVSIETEKPLLMDLLKKENIQIIEDVKDWQEAILVASQPLKNVQAITDNYIEAMIQTIRKMGPYIVISPKVAIPHARPEDGVNRLGMSLLKLTKSVPFSEKGTHDVQLIIVLAAIDGDTHLKALSQLTNMLSNESTKQEIIKAESSEEIFQYIKVYSE